MYKSTKEIAAEIRQELKVRYPEAKFSVSKQSFSMGSSISVVLMSAPFEALEANQPYTSDGRNHAQLNEYQLVDSYRKEERNSNGAILTVAGWRLMREVVVYLNSLKWFDTRYSFLHLEIGKWDKPFTVRS